VAEDLTALIDAVERKDAAWLDEVISKGMDDMAKIEGHSQNSADITVDDAVFYPRSSSAEPPKRGRPPTDQTVKALREQLQALEQKVDILAQAFQEYVEKMAEAVNMPQLSNGIVPGLAALQVALRDDPKFRSDMLLKAELIDQKVGGHLQQFVMALAYK